MIEILENGILLCQIIVKLFPATDCLLLEKGPEFAIHRIIFFLEFCRCLGISNTVCFKLSDLIPSLIQDESSSGFLLLKTISVLEKKAAAISNWHGPFLELDSSFQDVNLAKRSQFENANRGSVISPNQSEKEKHAQRESQFRKKISDESSSKGSMIANSPSQDAIFRKIADDSTNRSSIMSAQSSQDRIFRRKISDQNTNRSSVMSDPSSKDPRPGSKISDQIASRSSMMSSLPSQEFQMRRKITGESNIRASMMATQDGQFRNKLSDESIDIDSIAVNSNTPSRGAADRRKISGESSNSSATMENSSTPAQDIKLKKKLHNVSSNRDSVLAPEFKSKIHDDTVLSASVIEKPGPSDPDPIARPKISAGSSNRSSIILENLSKQGMDPQSERNSISNEISVKSGTSNPSKGTFNFLKEKVMQRVMPQSSSEKSKEKSQEKQNSQLNAQAIQKKSKNILFGNSSPKPPFISNERESEDTNEGTEVKKESTNDQIEEIEENNSRSNSENAKNNFTSSSSTNAIEDQTPQTASVPISVSIETLPILRKLSSYEVRINRSDLKFVFSTLMAHLIEYLDILAQNRKNEIQSLNNKVEDIYDKKIGKSTLLTLISSINKGRQEKESEVYYNHICEELKMIEEDREIAVSILGIHRRLSKNIKEVSDGALSGSSIGDIFLNFSNEILTPYVRYSVIFLDGKSTSSEEYLNISKPLDNEFMVEFVKKYIKPKDASMDNGLPNSDEWEQFIKYPLERLKLYGKVLDELMMAIKRPASDTENRKLKIAKLKILAAFQSIKEHLENSQTIIDGPPL